MPLRKTIFLTALAVLLASVLAKAQEQSESDSLVRLNYGKTAELLEIDGQSVRKVIGPAEFLHNNTYMLCDTALWNIDTGIIDAIGNVSLIQEGTTLTSDKMKYIVDEDLAQFRGVLVELVDSAQNVLRTSYLDYNTKDSVGVFNYGGSMRDKDGQLIESIQGTYESKAKLFTFIDEVNMFTDSIFVKTTRLEYRSDLNLATFGRETDAWKDENMLSADAGWYDRDREVFFFRNNVHVMNDTQEGWSDTLYFYRNTMDVDMLGHAQVSDSTRNVSGLAGKIMYVDSLSRVTMLREPAVVGVMDQNEQPDTVYVCADTIVYYTLRMCDIHPSIIEASEKRVEELSGDPVGAYREAAAEARRKAEEEALKNDPNYRPPTEDTEEDLEDEVDEGSESRLADEAADAEYFALFGPPSGEEEPEEAAADSLATSGADALNDSLYFSRDSLYSRDSLNVYGRDSLNIDVDSLYHRDSLDMGRDFLKADVDSLYDRTDSLAFNRDSLMFSRDSISYNRDSLKFMVDSLGWSIDSLGFLRDSLGVIIDSLGIGADSLFFATDSIVGPLDTTKVNFLWANGDIRMFREDLQMVCDSLEYCDLDSLTRLYKGTVIWNEVTQQYSADSVMLVVRNGAMEKANLMSEAYVIIEEEEDAYYDQIKSVEAIAYFDSAGQLSRFDALGTATGAFFLREEEVVATVNKTESKMLSAVFDDGEIDKVYYFQDVESDAYPVVQLPKEEQTFKGFLWQPERRPDSPEAVTTRKVRSSMRERYNSRPRAAFEFTEIYFPGYIPGIYVEIQQRDSLDRIHAAERREAAAIREAFLADSLERVNLYHLIDSTSVIDTLALRDSLALADSLARADRRAMVEERKREIAEADSLAMTDSLSAPREERVLTKEELKAKELAEKQAAKEAARKAKEAAREAARAEREAARLERLAEREAKWEMLDSLDAAKVLAKEEKKAEKLRQKKLKTLTKADATYEAEEAILEKYVQRIEKSEEKKEARRAVKEEKKAAKREAKAAKKGWVLGDDEDEEDDGIESEDDGETDVGNGVEEDENYAEKGETEEDNEETAPDEIGQEDIEADSEEGADDNNFGN